MIETWGAKKRQHFLKSNHPRLGVSLHVCTIVHSQIVYSMHTCPDVSFTVLVPHQANALRPILKTSGPFLTRLLLSLRNENWQRPRMSQNRSLEPHIFCSSTLSLSRSRFIFSRSHCAIYIYIIYLFIYLFIFCNLFLCWRKAAWVDG